MRQHRRSVCRYAVIGVGIPARQKNGHDTRSFVFCGNGFFDRIFLSACIGRADHRIALRTPFGRRYPHSLLYGDRPGHVSADDTRKNGIRRLLRCYYDADTFVRHFQRRRCIRRAYNERIRIFYRQNDGASRFRRQKK